MDNWAIGVSTFDGSVPVQSQAQMAASLIGQGGVRMNPLNMASVVVDRRSGTFRQPYLVSPEVDRRTLAKASRTMSPATLSQLRELMQYTAASGTAAEAMAGLGPNYGAKTGSAEVDGQEKPNGWFTAYRGDLAGAGVVVAGRPRRRHGGSDRGGAAEGGVVRWCTFQPVRRLRTRPVQGRSGGLGAQPPASVS